MRLDVFLAQNENVRSRTKAREMIERSLVTVNGVIATKPSENVTEQDVVAITEKLKFVSKGGDKLEKAVAAFYYDVKGKVFVDVGASNGGFTDCLLQRGAKKVYCVDVGENQLDEKLKSDDRVVVMDRTNGRDLKKDMFEEDELFAVSDVSFISVELIIPPLSGIVQEMLLLIKPQFICGKKALNKNGIVTSDKDRLSAILKVNASLRENGFYMNGLVIGASGKNKNTEYVCLATKNEGFSEERIASIFEKLK